MHSMATFEKDCCVHAWILCLSDTVIGENFTCRREPTNAHNTDVCLSIINFTAYLFSCVWIQLTCADHVIALNVTTWLV